MTEESPTNRPPGEPSSPSVSLRDVVGRHITVLQGGYLGDRPEAVATLAKLRRGAGRPVGVVPELWGLSVPEELYEAAEKRKDGLPALTVEQAEEAAHLAITLWATHQQSHREKMHLAEGRELGAAVRMLAGKDGRARESVLKRFVRVGTATSLSVLAQRLRDIVTLLRRDAIALDYGLLAEQLYHWQKPGGPQRVRRSWGRSFHAHRVREDTQNGPNSDADGSAGSADD